MPTIEVVDPAPPRELANVAAENGLAPTSAAALIAAYRPHFDQAHPLIEEARGITVTDATQVTAIKAARRVRLQLREVRVAAEKTRKALKEDSLRTGKAIDGMNAVLRLAIEPEEARLEECEKFAERVEAQRKAALKAAREDLLRPFGIDTSCYMLAEMPEDTFGQLLYSTRVAHEARLEAAKKAEAERIAAEAKRAEEEARIKAENERLRLEAQKRETALQIERERAAADARAAAEKARQEREAIEARAAEERKRLEDQARADREAREKLEREAAAKRAQEARVASEAAKAKRAAELAPDREKLLKLAEDLRAFPMPTLAAQEAKRVGMSIVAEINDLARAIEEAAERFK